MKYLTLISLSLCLLSCSKDNGFQLPSDPTEVSKEKHSPKGTNENQADAGKSEKTGSDKQNPSQDSNTQNENQNKENGDDSSPSVENEETEVVSENEKSLNLQKESLTCGDLDTQTESVCSSPRDLKIVSALIINEVSLNVCEKNKTWAVDNENQTIVTSKGCEAIFELTLSDPNTSLTETQVLHKDSLKAAPSIDLLEASLVELSVMEQINLHVLDQHGPNRLLEVPKGSFNVFISFRDLSHTLQMTSPLSNLTLIALDHEGKVMEIHKHCQGSLCADSNEVRFKAVFGIKYVLFLSTDSFDNVVGAIDQLSTDVLTDN